MDNELVVLSKIEEINKVKWSEFVSNHIEGNFFQTPEFYEVCKNTPLYGPIIIIVKKETDIVGVLLANIQKQFNNIIGTFTSRAVVLGGPIIQNNDPEILDTILKHYKILIENKVIYSQYRNLFAFQYLKDVFISNGYEYEDHLNVYVDLQKTEQEIWSGINSKAKNRIRAAQKQNTNFVIENNFDALVKCYEILQEVYLRIKLPLVNFDYFLNLYKLINVKTKFIIFTAQFENNIIGFLFAIGYKETLFGLFNGAKQDFNNKCPNDLLPWEIFKWAKDNGYKKFDWLGAGKPGIPYGVRDYKMKFAGELINFGRFVKIHKPFLFNIGKIGLMLYKYLKIK